MNIFITATIVSVIYLISKIIESRFNKEKGDNFSLKLIVRDTLLVYFSVLVGHFIIGQITPLIGEENVIIAPSVFTGNPDF